MNKAYHLSSLFSFDKIHQIAFIDILSDKGKLIVAKLQGIVGKKNQLSLEFSDLQILESHYNKLLKEELSKETSFIFLAS